MISTNLSTFYYSYGDGSKPWYLVNPKIAGKWMFIPLKMVLIGIDPYPYLIHMHSSNISPWELIKKASPRLPGAGILSISDLLELVVQGLSPDASAAGCCDFAKPPVSLTLSRCC